MQEIFLCNLSVIILYTYFHYHLYSKNHLLNYPEQNFGQLIIFSCTIGSIHSSLILTFYFFLSILHLNIIKTLLPYFLLEISSVCSDYVYAKYFQNLSVA
mgnify:CR=1 FL=1